LEIANTPVLGNPAPLNALRTAQKLSGFALRHAVQDTQDYLDVGCGNGFITSHVAVAFARVAGVDVEPSRLADFRKWIGPKSKYEIRDISGPELPFDDASFDFATSFEVLEHVVDPEQTVSEIIRVLRPGGRCVISVPHTGFPIETHGFRWDGVEHHRKVPLLPYLRPLHRRLSLARIFSPRELDNLFVRRGMHVIGTAYATPQFERDSSAATGWERHVARVRPLLDKSEKIPGLRRFTGVSLLKAYEK
jgi:SAM-dependent methyltransferase